MAVCEMDVIVIGAGISGLAATRVLHNEGVQVKCLEARGRIGGRVHTVTLPADPDNGLQEPECVDLGANYLIGCSGIQSDQPLFHMAKLTGTETVTCAGDVKLKYRGWECAELADWRDHVTGRKISYREVGKMHYLTEKCLYRAFQLAKSEGRFNESAEGEKGQLVGNFASLMRCALLEILQLEVKHDLRTVPHLSRIEKGIYDSLMARYVSYVNPLHRLPMELLCELFSDENADFSERLDIFYPPEESISAFCQQIEDKFEALSNYEPSVANHVSVKWEDRLVTNRFDNIINGMAQDLPVELNTRVTHINWSSTPLEVHTESPARVYKCQHCIITIPVSVLKGLSAASCITFTPALPGDKRQAIDRLGIPMVGAATHNKVILRYKPEDIFWDEAAPHIKCPDPRFHLLNLHKYGKPGVLLAHIWGGSGLTTNGKTDDELVSLIRTLLEGMYQQEGRVFPKPVQYRVTRWSEDPFTLGAYTAGEPGSGDRDRQLYAGSLPSLTDEKLLFAGEATLTSHQAKECTHGAMLSGFDRANRLVNKLLPSRCLPKWKLAKYLLGQVGSTDKRETSKRVPSKLTENSPTPKSAAKTTKSPTHRISRKKCQNEESRQPLPIEPLQVEKAQEQDVNVKILHRDDPVLPQKLILDLNDSLPKSRDDSLCTEETLSVSASEASTWSLNGTTRRKRVSSKIFSGVTTSVRTRKSSLYKDTSLDNIYSDAKKRRVKNHNCSENSSLHGPVASSSTPNSLHSELVQRRLSIDSLTSLEDSLLVDKTQSQSHSLDGSKSHQSVTDNGAYSMLQKVILQDSLPASPESSFMLPEDLCKVYSEPNTACVSPVHCPKKFSSNNITPIEKQNRPKKTLYQTPTKIYGRPRIHFASLYSRKHSSIPTVKRRRGRPPGTRANIGFPAILGLTTITSGNLFDRVANPETLGMTTITSGNLSDKVVNTETSPLSSPNKSPRQKRKYVRKNLVSTPTKDPLGSTTITPDNLSDKVVNTEISALSSPNKSPRQKRKYVRKNLGSTPTKDPFSSTTITSDKVVNTEMSPLSSPNKSPRQKRKYVRKNLGSTPTKDPLGSTTITSGNLLDRVAHPETLGLSTITSGNLSDKVVNSETSPLSPRQKRKYVRKNLGSTPTKDPLKPKRKYTRKSSGSATPVNSPQKSQPVTPNQMSALFPQNNESYSPNKQPLFDVNEQHLFKNHLISLAVISKQQAHEKHLQQSQPSSLVSSPLLKGKAFDSLHPSHLPRVSIQNPNCDPCDSYEHIISSNQFNLAPTLHNNTQNIDLSERPYGVISSPPPIRISNNPNSQSHVKNVSANTSRSGHSFHQLNYVPQHDFYKIDLHDIPPRYVNSSMALPKSNADLSTMPMKDLILSQGPSQIIDGTFLQDVLRNPMLPSQPSTSKYDNNSHVIGSISNDPNYNTKPLSSPIYPQKIGIAGPQHYCTISQTHPQNLIKPLISQENPYKIGNVGYEQNSTILQASQHNSSFLPAHKHNSTISTEPQRNTTISTTQHNYTISPARKHNCSILPAPQHNYTVSTEYKLNSTILPAPQHNSTLSTAQHNSTLSTAQHNYNISPVRKLNYNTLPAPQHNSTILPAPRHNATILPAPRHNSAILPAPQHNATILPAPRHNSAILPAPQHNSTILPAPRHNSTILPAPQHNSPNLPAPRHNSAILPAPQHNSAILPAPQHNSTISPAPRHNSAILPAPKHNLTILPAPKHNSAILPAPKHNLTILPAPKHNSTILPAPKHNSTILPAPKHNSTILPAPQHCNSKNITSQKNGSYKTQNNYPVPPLSKLHCSQNVFTSPYNQFFKSVNMVGDTSSLCYVMNSTHSESILSNNIDIHPTVCQIRTEPQFDDVMDYSDVSDSPASVPGTHTA